MKLAKSKLKTILPAPSIKALTNNPAMRQKASVRFGGGVGRPLSPQNILKGSGKSIGQMKYTAVRNAIPQAYVGVRSFPGTAQGVSGVADGTKGRFVQSIKGMKGKKYMEKAMTQTMNMYMGGE